MATTNLNLNTLAGTEKLKSFPTPYNDNMTAIDGAFGAGFGVGNNSSVNAELNGLGNGMAIIANGNTHAAITSGQYVYVRQHGSLSEGLYKATSNISANGTLSGSNLTAVSSGGLNDVYSTLNSKIDISQYTTLTTASGVSGTIYLGRLGKQRVLTGYFKPDNIGTNILVATLGSSDKPPVMIYGSCTGYNVGAQSEISIDSNGEIKANVPSGGNNNTIKFNASWFVN